jgi:UDP-N-acetylmuramate--alanine ligase
MVGAMQSGKRLRYHFSGLAGAGMNPLAQLMVARGHAVQGSDRSFDQGKNAELRARLAALGISVMPQDGAAVTPDLDRFVYSTAVEADTPEFRAARAHGLELVPRPALLAEIVDAGCPGVAIAGTSGKSTITGMLAWLTQEARLASTVIGGAALAGEGVSGCFRRGPVDGPVVAEACESDGTLRGYHPGIGIIHNVSRDHAEVDALRPQFEAFARQCRQLLVNAACPEAARLGRAVGALSYGSHPSAEARLDILSAGPHRATGTLRLGAGALALDIPQPGLHNLENAAAAALAALELDIEASAVEAHLARFPGVARRFEIVGTTADGIRVVDDYAHNGEKLRAAITTAQSGARRVLAVFQPHGFGPARFLRPELRELLPRLLRSPDRFCYAEIYYAGGTVARDVSSRMLADDLPRDVACGYAADHAAVVDWVLGQARACDTILIMGARDPELPALARKIFAALVAARGAAPA